MGWQRVGHNWATNTHSLVLTCRLGFIGLLCGGEQSELGLGNSSTSWGGLSWTYSHDLTSLSPSPNLCDMGMIAASPGLCMRIPWGDMCGVLAEGLPSESAGQCQSLLVTGRYTDTKATHMITLEEEAGTKFDCSLLKGQYLRDKGWWKRKSGPPALFRRPATWEGGGLIS